MNARSIIRPALVTLLGLTLLPGVAYPLAVTGLAALLPAPAPESLVGQEFTDPGLFSFGRDTLVGCSLAASRSRLEADIHVARKIGADFDPAGRCQMRDGHSRKMRPTGCYVCDDEIYPRCARIGGAGGPQDDFVPARV